MRCLAGERLHRADGRGGGVSLRPLLAVIPARGGSKGLPGKNIRPLAGLPLIAHSIRCAAACPEIDRAVVSTDSEEIAAVARAHGGDVPFRRPADLATDTAPMIAVVQHALREVERLENRRFEAVLLLDPTSPGRLPEDIARAFHLLAQTPEADGVVGVSRPEFNPLWVCVVEREGWMAPLIPDTPHYTRRQDVPPVYRVNATLYLWRRDFLLGVQSSWRHGRHLMLEVPEKRAVHLDEAEEFERTDLLLRAGFLTFPWLGA